MLPNRLPRLMRLAAPAALAAGSLLAGHAARAQQVGDVFCIDMENHNFTQPSTYTSTQALLGNPAAPYQTSLITPGNPNAAQTSYASNYHNVGTGIHPSEPNYIWQEGGSNFGVAGDADPGTGTGTSYPNGNNFSQPNLSGLLQNAGISWKSYQEDIDLTPTSGTVNHPGSNALTSSVAPSNQDTVPVSSFSGTSASYTNAYNGSHQYNFAPKHDGTLFYQDTNGSLDPTTANPEVSHYEPLQQLTADLSNNAVGRYNLITPDQFNDSHTALTGGFTYNGTHYTGDAANIAQGDNFLSQIIPQIQASQAYQNNGAIVIWWDETEGGDSSAYTLEEIVISKLAKGNAYDSTLDYTHSSDLKTLQELFSVGKPGGGFLGDAATPGTNDLSDLFQPGAITAPEPSQFAALGLGALSLAGLALQARKRKSA